MLLRIADEKRLPFAVQVPNAATAEAVDRILFPFIKQAFINEGTSNPLAVMLRDASSPEGWTPFGANGSDDGFE